LKLADAETAKFYKAPDCIDDEGHFPITSEEDFKDALTLLDVYADRMKEIAKAKIMSIAARKGFLGGKTSS
jgi:hypothetical protein